MGSSEVQTLVHDLKLSSVVPARVTSEQKSHELTNTDLATKLHYVRGIYLFRCDAVQGLDVYALKEPMFRLLDLYYPASGRIRRSESGRPFIKCNDSGVRIVEAKCRVTVDEWLGSDGKHGFGDGELVPDHVLGPDLGFSPLLFMQFTWFACGGLSVGLSWAHVLGDVFSASAFVNMWGQMMTGHVPRHPLTLPSTRIFFPNSFSKKPISLKKIEPVGDHWLIPSTQKMETHSFHVTEKILSIKAENHKIFPFLTALLWKSISKTTESKPKIVTICRKGYEYIGNEIPCNAQMIGIVESDFDVENTDLLHVAKWVDEKISDERGILEDYMEKQSEKSDFILYGANLTFVDLEEANTYGLELRGNKPFFANFSIFGVGNEGAVLVLPREAGGRTVTVILPENQIIRLKEVLKKEWGIS